MSARTNEPASIAGDATPNGVQKKSGRPRIIALGVLTLGLVGVIAWYALHAGEQGTDDAQVEANVVAVPSRIGGVVQKVLIKENQAVEEGQPIAELDPAQQTARVAQAEAEVLSAQAGADAADAQVAVVQASAKGQRTAAEASLKGMSVGVVTTADDIASAKAAVAAATATRRQAELELERAKALFAQTAVPKSRLDAAQNGFDAADAALSQAKARLSGSQSSTALMEARVSEARGRVGQSSAVDAQIAAARAAAAVAHARVETTKALRDLARLDLGYTKILSPASGIASKKSIEVGQMVTAGQPIVMIVPTKNVWVTANFKETQLERLKVGQTAEVEIDAFPGLRIKGEVLSLSGATGSRFSLLPAENATGNFVKVVQRVPVRIKLNELPEDKELRPGMSANVVVNVRSK